MTFDEYLKRVALAGVTYPTWRKGQTYFNVLAEVRPNIAEMIRGGRLDPYYDDLIVPEFLAFLDGTQWWSG